MEGHGSKFDHKKDEAMVALLSHRSVEEAAKAIDISPSTLFNWMKDPEFLTSYREARRTAFSQSMARLQNASGAAVSTLLKVMIDPGTPPAAKIRAADSVLSHSARSMELEDVEARVAQLERASEARKGR